MNNSAGDLAGIMIVGSQMIRATCVLRKIIDVDGTISYPFAFYGGKVDCTLCNQRYNFECVPCFYLLQIE